MLYADDSTYFWKVKFIEWSVEAINKDLNLLSKWYARNKLSLNLTTTKAIIFGNRPIWQ